MSTAETLVDIYKSLLSFDSSTLKKVRAYVNSLKSDGWDSLSKQQQGKIEEAILSLKNGEGKSHEKVMAKYKGKYL